MSMYGKYKKVYKDGVLVKPVVKETIDCSKDPVLTVQAPREEVDINKIVKRMEKGQMIDSRILREGVYEDVSELGDLSECIIKVQNAWDDFMTLPADVREKFENNPTKLVDFLADGNNREDAEKLGLVNPRPAGEPASIPPATGESTPV